MEETGIPYDGWGLAIWFVFDSFILGNTDRAPFELGDASQSNHLHFIFILAVGVILLHLLNMLIAIMGNTFAERSLVVEEVKSKDHLLFVMDNWHLLYMAFNDLKHVKYIVAAFYASQDDESLQITEGINRKIDELAEHQRHMKSFVVDMALN
jgi:hypothetical protein